MRRSLPFQLKLRHLRLGRTARSSGDVQRADQFISHLLTLLDRKTPSYRRCVVFQASESPPRNTGNKEDDRRQTIAAEGPRLLAKRKR